MAYRRRPNYIAKNFFLGLSPDGSGESFPIADLVGDRYYHSANGETASSPSPAWEVGQNPGSTTQQVVDNGSATDGKEVEFSHGGSGRNVWLLTDFTEDTQDDQDIVLRLKMDDVSTNFSPSIALRYTGSAGSENKVIAEFVGTNVNLWYGVSGSFTFLGGYSYTRTVNTYFKIRFQVFGDRLRSKAWDDGDDEPADWGRDVTNVNIPSAGRMGITLTGTATATMDVDFVSGGIDGTCGIASSEANLPSDFILQVPSAFDGGIRWRKNATTGEENYVIAFPDMFSTASTISGQRGITQSSLNGDIFLTNRTDGIIYKMNYYGRSHEVFLSGRTDPYGVAVAETEDKLIFSQAGDGDVYTCNLSDGSDITNIKTGVGTTSFHLQWSASENRIYYTENNQGRWMNIDGSNDTLLYTLPGGFAISIWSNGTYVLGSRNGTNVAQVVYEPDGTFVRNTATTNDLQQAILTDTTEATRSYGSSDDMDKYDILTDSFLGNITFNGTSSGLSFRGMFPGQTP